MSSGNEFDALFVEFSQALRHAGLPVGTDDVLTFSAAVTDLDATDIVDVYWAGRTTLVRKREHIPTYNAVFRAFFLADVPDAADPRRRQ